MVKLNQKGVAHLALIALALIGILLFVSLSSTAPFKNQLLSSLFPKSSSQAAGVFNCTLVIGYSQTNQWFYGANPIYDQFQSRVGDGNFELLWQGGGASLYWADPNDAGWSNSIESGCSSNPNSPDRLLLDITHNAYLNQDPNPVATMKQIIQQFVATARAKYPSATQVILQPVVGGPNESVCQSGGVDVRASVNHPYIHQAINQVVNGNDVVMGYNSTLDSCSEYADSIGHLVDPDGRLDISVKLGNFYAGSSGTATPSPTPSPGNQTLTIIFDDIGFKHLSGVYPDGVIDWGDGFVWHVYNPEGLVNYNVSYNDPGDVTMPFTFVTPRKLYSFDVYNRGERGPSTTVTISCAGNPVVSKVVPAFTLTNVVTNWANPCTTVDLASTNGWDALYDNFVVDATGLPSSTPAVSPTPTPTPTPAPTGAFTVDFNTLSVNSNFSGTYPTNTITWPSGVWAISAPWRTLTTNNLGFINQNVSSGTFTFVQPRTVVSIDAFNGGTTASTITLTCAGNTTKSVSVAANQLLAISTGWNSPCTAVTLASSNGWDTNFDNLAVGSLSLMASPTPSTTPKLGDIDGNGRVDIFDYNMLLTNFGKTGTNLQGDLDQNNRVDIFDYNILLTNFGK